MTEVATRTHHARHGSDLVDGAMLRGAPTIEMMPNPEFSFPAQPLPSPSTRLPPTTGTSRRPVSMHGNAPPALHIPLAHRRAASTLPSFSFNAADATGLAENSTPPRTPDEAEPHTPSRKGHKRGASEFVGGDSRLGVTGAISSSPTKTNSLPLPVSLAGPPPGRRGHAHRRSAAMSSHDVSDIMKPTEPEPRLSSSLPSTPFEHPSEYQPQQADKFSSIPDTPTELVSSFGPPLAETSEARPSSRLRVGFADAVEYIPRPLSTISSETEGSVSTVRGHSVNNSISSVLSLSTPSPPSARTRHSSLSTTFEDDATPKARPSLEISRRVEKEGEWLRSSSSSSSMKRPISESAAAPVSPHLSFAVPDGQQQERNLHVKKHSISHALGFDRRRSEPTISIPSDSPARLSAISLQEETESGIMPHIRAMDRRSSTRKIKDWAMSRLAKRTSSEAVPTFIGASRNAQARPQAANEFAVPGRVPRSDTTVAETDLDAVFGGQDDTFDNHGPATQSQPRFEMNTPTPSYTSSFGSRDADDSPVLDLDAALGPFKTPSYNTHKPRRELHSSRLNKDYGGPGLNYHRRAESAPELPPSGLSRSSMASQSSLPDVFEGEGEEEAETHGGRHDNSSLGDQEESGTGIQVVDSESETTGSSLNFDDGLRIRQGQWEMERPATSYNNLGPRLSTPTLDRRPSSIVEETIPEELSPTEPVEIVEAHEEPRASSLTKSSDSSETPTILASQTGLSVPMHEQTMMTPDSYHTSTCSSPEIYRRQGSIDTSRLGTSASSVTDNRTLSSCTGEPARISTDDVPSLSSSLSTRLSTMHANTSRRDFSGSERMASGSDSSGAMDPSVAAEWRRKRGSIQSLSQLMGGSFGGRSKSDLMRPQTASEPVQGRSAKKEHRLKKLMFWRSKSKQSLRSEGV